MNARPPRDAGSRLPRVALAVALLALSAWSIDAFAWSKRAHAMVGDIATRFLTPEATREVAVLLRDDLGADEKPSGAATLGQVASWPDELRASANDRGTYNYHFDDIPICGGPHAIDDRERYCKDGQCGTAWFDRQLAILEDRSQPKRLRNEALKWIVHLVGDLHQPLHASDHDDKGGNDVKVTYLGRRSDPPVDGREQRPYNLHSAWDRLIPYDEFDRVGGDAAFLADLPIEQTRKDWSVGDIRAWTAESYVLARDFLYPNLATTFTCDRPITGLVPLDADYVRPASVIAAMQIRKAGVRLAKVLNDALGAAR